MQVHPNASVAQWLNDAAGAAQAVSEGLNWEVYGWVGGLITILGLAAKFGPAFGPAGAAISSAVQGLVGLIKPGAVKQAEDRAQIAEASIWQIVEAIEQVVPDDPVIKQLKKAISEKTPAEFNALFDAWKKRRYGG